MCEILSWMLEASMCGVEWSRNEKESLGANYAAIKEEVNNGDVEGLRRHVEVHSDNENEAL